MRFWSMISQRFRAPHLMERMMRRFGVMDRVKGGMEGVQKLRAAAMRASLIRQLRDEERILR